MNWNTPRLSTTKHPKEYAFSCFDNAVRFAYYYNAAEPESKWYVVAGTNAYGIHYGYMRVGSDGYEDIYDFDSDFINGVELRISLDTAIKLRKLLIQNDRTRISPCVDQPERSWMNPSQRFIPDARVALAPEVIDVHNFITTGSFNLS